MVNPFNKRATEYLRDDTAFLSVVVPEPFDTFFEKHAKEGNLYDRLSLIVGTPGSGKTTISSLLQYKTLKTLLENPNLSEYRPLQKALKNCGIIETSTSSFVQFVPKFLGCRIPMESEYRDFWELPYSPDIKMGLLKSFLQARAMISWIGSIENASEITDSQVSIRFREGMEVASSILGGTDGKSLYEKAKDVELAIYKIVTDFSPSSGGKIRKHRYKSLPPI